MAQSRHEKNVQPSMLARTEDIQQQIQELSGRDLQLWSIGILIMLVLTAGLLALVLPNLVWAQRVIRVEQAYLPQLFFGLISLVLLFNIYLLTQKRTLNSTRHSLIDPRTQLLNRRAVNELIPREVARANRLGSNLTLMSIDLSGFRQINSKFGSLEGDAVLAEFARILKSVFRGGDVVFRQGGDEFLILMPETTEEQADFPRQRLHREVEQWNLNSKKDFEMAFTWALASYVTGTDADEVLRAVDRKLYQKKNKLVPVF